MVEKKTGKLSNMAISQNEKGISGFPEVPVDQTNVRISDIIRRNLAGEQVLGTTKLAYDFLGTEEFMSMEVNPFNTLDFDLDDTIRLADKVGMQISDLTSEKATLDKALQEKLASLKKSKEADAAAQAQKIEEAKNE